MSSVHSWVTPGAEGQDLHHWKDHPERRKLRLPRREVRQEGPSGFPPEPKPWVPAASPAEAQGPWPCRRGLFLFSVSTPHFLWAGKAVCEQEITKASSCLAFFMVVFSFVESFGYRDFTLCAFFSTWKRHKIGCDGSDYTQRRNLPWVCTAVANWDWVNTQESHW